MLPDLISRDTALGRALRWPFRFIPPDRPRRILGGPLAGCRWHPGSGPVSIWLGLYERRMQSAFQRRCQGLVWDVGAHAGLYSLIAARRSARVYAFEPLEENRSWLRRNLRVNGLEHRVTILPFALGDRSGAGRFYAEPSGMEGQLSDEGGTTIEVRSPDALDLQPPDVLKIDVEGAEAAVLRGARAILRDHRPVIFLEEHGETTEPRTILMEHGYSQGRIEPRRFLWLP